MRKKLTEQEQTALNKMVSEFEIGNVIESLIFFVKTTYKEKELEKAVILAYLIPLNNYIGF